MTVIRQYRIGGNPKGDGGGPFGMIGSIIMLVLGLLLAYMVIKGVFTLLFWLSPVLLIAGIAIDPKGALNIGKSFINLAKKNPLIPIGIVILCALWFPVIPGVIGALTGGFLLAKYFVKKKIKTVFNQHAPQEPAADTEEFVEYEEVKEDEDFLQLPSVEPKAEPQARSNNEYDNMF